MFKDQMLGHIWRCLLLVVFLAFPGSPAAGGHAAALGTTGLASAAATSMLFIENTGQYPAEVRFAAMGGDRVLWLTADALWIQMNRPAARDRPGRAWENALRPSGTGPRRAPLRLSFEGASPHARLEPFDRLSTRVTYFVGDDPARWRADVPVWGGVRYVGLYPGIDLEMAGVGPRWGVRWVTQPGADVAAVSPRLNGAPVDSDLLYGTFLGGLNWDYGDGIVVDAAGHAYVAGMTASPGFPGGQGTPATELAQPEDVFVAQLDEAGSTLVYVTVFGGTRGDWGHALAVDAAGAAYVVGGTNSFDFPTTPGAFDTSFGGFTDAFVTKLAPGGAVIEYSTLLGGLDDEWGWAIAVDATGSAYVTGDTESSDFPRAGGSDLLNGYEAFVTKLNATGSGLIYSRLLGGTEREIGYGIAVDTAGAAYVTGATSSVDFPVTPGVFAPAFGGGAADAFVAQYDPSGTALVYATYLGGDSEDRGHAVAIDSSGAAYVTGRTLSAQFPTTPGAFDAVYNGGDGDAFVARLAPGGAALSYSTFLGGAGADLGLGVATDASGAACVTGRTSSSGFPVTPLAFDTGYSGGVYDAFVTRLAAGGTRLLYSTFLGGSGTDEGYAVALDAAGAVYVTGSTGSADFPATPGAVDPTYNGSYQDAFVARLRAPDVQLMHLPLIAANAPDGSAGPAMPGAQAPALFVAHPHAQ